MKGPRLAEGERMTVPRPGGLLQPVLGKKKKAGISVTPAFGHAPEGSY